MSLLLGYLAAGSSMEEVIAEFPDLKAEHIAVCLDYVRDPAGYDVAA